MSKTVTVAIGSKTVLSITTDEDISVTVDTPKLPWEKEAEEPLEVYPDSSVVDHAVYNPEEGVITFDLYSGNEYTVKADESDWRSLLNGDSAGRLFNRLTRRNKTAN